MILNYFFTFILSKMILDVHLQILVLSELIIFWKSIDSLIINVKVVRRQSIIPKNNIKPEVHVQVY